MGGWRRWSTIPRRSSPTRGARYRRRARCAAPDRSHIRRASQPCSRFRSPSPAARDGDADSGRILVIGGAEQLHRSAVQEESLTRVNADGSDAEPSLCIVDDLSVAKELGAQRVEGWIVD